MSSPQNLPSASGSSSHGGADRARRPSASLIDVPAPSTHVTSPLIIPLSPGSVKSTESMHSLTQLGSHPCEMGGGQPDDRRPYRDFPERERPPPRRSSSGNSIIVVDETSPLLAANGPDTGKWYRGPLFQTGVKLSILFGVFSILVLGTFYFGLPKVEPEDRPDLKLPRSFAELKALNTLLKKYKDLYPWRICLCFVVAYLYVQAFTLPGSMYLSILFGASYGIVTGVILSCICESCGSILCYTLSSFLGPPLLELPYYRRMLDKWRKKIMGDHEKGEEVGKDSIFTILIVLRILPFPPHWVANFVAPHLGIGMGLFWLAAFIGIAPVSVIHCVIGSSLDEMTSADDFKILSVRNILGLAAVIVAVLIPVGLKRVFRTDLGDLGEEEVTGVLDDIPAPVVVEFDENGLPRRTQAVDSGVQLAGPSPGDPNLDLDTRPRKGKGKAVRAAWFDTANDDDAGASAYELRDPDQPLQPKKSFGFNPFKAAREYNPLRSYGTITLDHVEHGASTPWWRWSRRGGAIQL